MGISLAGTLTTDNSIVGNFIGTGAAGAGQLANTGNGININGATDTLIGGPTAGAANTIAFNGGNGVNVAPAPAIAFRGMPSAAMVYSASISVSVA